MLIAPKSLPDHADPFCWVASAAMHGSPGFDDSLSFDGVANIDRDGDGLEALVEHALGTSDADPGSGLDRVRGEILSGEFRYSYTVSRNATSVKVRPEVSLDLNTWSQNSELVEFISRRENEDGTETFLWRPVALEPKVFFRLNVTQ